jgi:hypothetical protein
LLSRDRECGPQVRILYPPPTIKKMKYKLSDVTNFIGLTGAKPAEQEAPVLPETPPEPVGEKQVILAWEIQARQEKKTINLKFQKMLIVIGVVVALLLAIMGEFFLILVIASLIFVSYVLYSTPPETVKYELSTHGVEVSDQFYPWKTLKQFFFSTNTSPGKEVLVVDTIERFPGRLFIHFTPEQRETLKETFSKYIPFVKEEPITAMDKAYLSFLDKFNLHSEEDK